MKRIKHNDLVPWFTDDHRTLPASYKRSFKKFFKELSAKLDKTKLKDYKGCMRKIRSKHNNLLNYFLYDDKYLSPAYIKKCKKFFKEIERKNEKK